MSLSLQLEALAFPVSHVLCFTHYLTLYQFVLVWNLHFGITSLKKMESHFSSFMVQELLVENNSLCGMENQI